MLVFFSESQCLRGLYMAVPSALLRQIGRPHWSPIGPVVLRSVTPDVQAVRNASVVEEARKTLVRGAADVVFAGRQHPFVAAVLIQVVAVGHVLQKARRVQK